MSDTNSSDGASLRCMELWGGNGSASEAVSVPGVDVYVRGEAHGGGAEGGDVYYVSLCGAGNIARVALADVAGHGEGVAEVSRTLRGLMRRHINTVDQTKMVRALNAAFDGEERGGRFATAVLATYFAPTDHLIVVNAGYPPPLRWRAGEGAWSYLTEEVGASAAEVGAGNLPLGIVEGTTYSQFAVGLEAGDLVVLYTDALPETADARGRMLGQQGLLELVRGLGEPSGHTVGDRLFEAAAGVRGGGAPADDQTVVVLSHNASGPGRQSVGERVRVLGRMMGIGRSGA